jgi:hypothetical protein
MSKAMQESTAPSPNSTTTQAQAEFSAEYSRGELEEMDSRELLDGYAE